MDRRAAFNCSIRCTGARASLALSAGRRSAGSLLGSVGRTIVRSANEAENLVGNLHYRLHRSHVMHSNHVSAAKDRRRNSSRRRAFKQFSRGLVRLGQKRLARRAHHDRQFQVRKFVQPRQDLRVLLLALSEPKPRINYDPRALHACANRAMHARVEKIASGYLQMRVPATERVRLVSDDAPIVAAPRRVKQ